MSEDALKKKLELLMEPFFIIQREQPGKFLVDGTSVTIDYMMKPKPELVRRGFVDDWFGLEVKSPKDAKKGLQVAWQAITYSQSEFDGRRPAFVLIYPELARFFDSNSDAYYVICLLQKANVGYLAVDERKRRWRIKFGANSYYDSVRGLSGTPSVATKRNVGSWK